MKGKEADQEQHGGEQLGVRGHKWDLSHGKKRGTWPKTEMDGASAFWPLAPKWLK